MKTAISIPDRVFAAADRLAKRLKKTRSRLYSEAIGEYLERHTPEEITAALDRVYGRLPDDDKPFRHAAIRSVLRRTTW